MTNTPLATIVDKAKCGNDEAITFLSKQVREGWHLNDEEHSCFLMGLWKAIKTFNPDLGHKFIHYARVVIKNEIISYYRYERLSKQWADIDEYIEYLSSPATSVEDVVETQESLRQVFQKLTNNEATVVYARFFLGLSHQEVGSSHNITERRSKYLQKVALSKLKNSLEEMV